MAEKFHEWFKPSSDSDDEAPPKSQIKIIHGELDVMAKAKPLGTAPYSDVSFATHLRLASRSGPNSSRTFDGFCFLCLYPLHSQKWCPLRQCALCHGFGHAETVCSKSKERAVSVDVRERLKQALAFSDSE